MTVRKCAELGKSDRLLSHLRRTSREHDQIDNEDWVWLVRISIDDSQPNEVDTGVTADANPMSVEAKHDNDIGNAERSTQTTDCESNEHKRFGTWCKGSSSIPVRRGAALQPLLPTQRGNERNEWRHPRLAKRVDPDRTRRSMDGTTVQAPREPARLRSETLRPLSGKPIDLSQVRRRLLVQLQNHEKALRNIKKTIEEKNGCPSRDEKVEKDRITNAYLSVREQLVDMDDEIRYGSAFVARRKRERETGPPLHIIATTTYKETTEANVSACAKALAASRRERADVTKPSPWEPRKRMKTNLQPPQPENDRSHDVSTRPVENANAITHQDTQGKTFGSLSIQNHPPIGTERWTRRQWP